MVRIREVEASQKISGTCTRGSPRKFSAIRWALRASVR